MSVTYEAPTQTQIEVGDCVEGIGIVLDPDDKRFSELMEQMQGQPALTQKEEGDD